MYDESLQVAGMNHGSALMTGVGEDPAIKALSHIFEKAALVNYKQVFAQLEGIYCTMVHDETFRECKAYTNSTFPASLITCF